MSLGFKLTVTQKDHANKIIERLMKDKGFNKTQAFMFILENYEDKKIGNTSGEYIETNIRDVLSEIGGKCEFIGFDSDKQVLVCREFMRTKKEPKMLEGSPQIVRKNCLGCLIGKLREAEREHNKLMQKESIKKLEEFMKGFVAISQSGFKYTAFLCLNNADSGHIVFSRGGDTLQCGEIEGELVDIKETCMEKINPNSHSKPCEYLASLEGIQSLNPDFIKNLHDILPDASFIGLTEKEKDDIINQNRRLGVEADYNVVDDEKKGEDNEE